MAKKKKGVKRRRLKGIGTKLGAILIGGVPLAASGVEAAVAAQGTKETNMLSKVSFGIFRFINNITEGFGLPSAFDTIRVTNDAGVSREIVVSDGWGGSKPFLMTTLSGLIMIGVDTLVGKLTKSATKLGGVTITGN